MSEIFRDMTRYKKEKRTVNTLTSTRILQHKGIEFISKNNGAHLIVGSYDFYPSTGLFIHRRTKKRGRGIYTLLKEV